MEGQAKDGLNIFCDIGRDITELLVFKDGLLKDMEILPIGGDRMAMQLQEELKLSYELAEEIKKSYGVAADPREINPEKEILIKKSTFYKPIKQRLVAEIVSASAKSVCLQIKEAIEKKLSCYEVNNFLLTGRAALLEGFIELLETTLSIPVKFGRIANPAIPQQIKESGELSGQKYLSYLTCLGMLCAALQEKTVARPSGGRPSGSLLSRALQRAREVYQEYF
jgi:cell division ATPase FtsA